MSFSGKYQQVSYENFEAFMKALGLPDDLIQKGKDVKSITEMEENGDTFKVTIRTGEHAVTNTFTIGQETEMMTSSGEMVKTVVSREGNKLRVNLKGIESVTELVDANTIVNTMTLGNIVSKSTSKRI